jgi:hypothetical protein
MSDLTWARQYLSNLPPNRDVQRFNESVKVLVGKLKSARREAKNK